MLPLKTTISGPFLDKIKERQSQWSSVRKIEAVITVPDDMKWWIYQEFGTAPHGIDAKPGGLLVFPNPAAPGGITKIPHVNHPGNKAYHMVLKVEEKCKAKAIADLHEYLTPNFNPSEYKAALLAETMPAIKEMIRASFEESLPLKYRDDGGGKLGGESAAEAFQSDSTITDKSI